MANQFSASDYFTKTQANRRFMMLPQPPVAPVPPVIADTGTDLVGQTASAFLDLTLTAPPTPDWVPSSQQYISTFCVIYTTGGVSRSIYFKALDAFQIDGLSAGATYSLQVSVIDYLGQQSPFSLATVTTTAVDTTPPAAPTITAVPQTTGALISVAVLNSESDFAGYQLFRGQVATLETDATLLPCARFDSASFTDNAVPTSGAYYYFLRALNFSGLHADSATIGPVTLVESPFTVPNTPSMVGATAVPGTDGSIQFTFPTPVDGLAQSYHIWRRQNAGGWIMLGTVPVPTGSPATIRYEDTTSVSGFTYRYSASIVDTTELEGGIDTVNAPSATALDTTAPTPISGQIQYAGETASLQVAWTGSSDPTTAFYLIRWRYQQIGAYSTFNAGTMVPGTSFSISGLIDPNTGVAPTKAALANEFEVEIAAVNQYGRASAFTPRMVGSVRSPVTYPELANYFIPTDQNIPSASLITSVSVNDDSSVTLNWTAPNSSTLYGYMIEQLKSGEPAWEVIQTSADGTIGSKQATISGLEPFAFNSAQYRFRVRAIDLDGNVAGANLLDNPSWDSGLTSWNSATAPGIVTPGRNGVGSEIRASTNDQVSQTIPVVAGNVYTVSGFVAEDTVIGLTPRLDVYWFDVTGAQLGISYGLSTQIASVYQRTTSTVIAPVGAVQAQLLLVSDPNYLAATVLWDDAQFEEGPRATPYNDGKTSWLNVIDTTGPAAYTTNFSVAPGLGIFILNWNNGTTLDYFECTYEIWRQRIASDATGFVADSGLIKIVEVSGTNDGHLNSWTDSSPNPNNHIQSIFALRARDRFGNANVTSGGAPAFLTTSTPQTSLNVNDQGIATTALTTALAEGLASAAAAASSAASAAASANTAIAAIASDNVLLSGDKSAVILDYTNIIAEQAGDDAQGVAYGIPSTITTPYDSAVAALTAYLTAVYNSSTGQGVGTGGTDWQTVTTSSQISGPVFRAAFALVYSCRQTLLNAIYAAAQAIAITAQTTASTAATTAAAAAATATSALGQVTVVSSLPAAAGYSGKWVYLSAVSGSFQVGIYYSNGTIWSQTNIDASLIVGQLIAGQIAAGTIGTEALAVGGIAVGGGPDMPGSIEVFDGSGDIAGYIGGNACTIPHRPIPMPAYRTGTGGAPTPPPASSGGAWFETLGVGGTQAAPALTSDLYGNLILRGSIQDPTGAITAIDGSGNLVLKNVLSFGYNTTGFWTPTTFAYPSSEGGIGPDISVTISGMNQLYISASAAFSASGMTAGEAVQMSISIVRISAPLYIPVTVGYLNFALSPTTPTGTSSSIIGVSLQGVDQPPLGTYLYYLYVNATPTNTTLAFTAVECAMQIIELG